MIGSLLLLFGASFLAATLLPFASEILLLALLAKGFPASLLWMAATAGNTLGSAVNWLLGAYLLQFRDRRWFYFDHDQVERGQQWFQRYGQWSLLLAWLPVVGDALTLVAGTLGMKLPLFLVLVALGKGVRYLMVLGLQYPLGLY